MTQLEKMQLGDIAELHGIVGIVAFLCQWCAPNSPAVDGLSFVKKSVESMTLYSVNDRLAAWKRTEEYRTQHRGMK